MKCDIKPNLRLVQQVAQLERFCGTWDRLSQSGSVASAELAIQALHEGVVCAFALDSSTDAPLALALGKLLEDSSKGERRRPEDRPEQLHTLYKSVSNTSLERYLNAHGGDFELSLTGIETLYRSIAGIAPEGSPGPAGPSFSYRHDVIQFTNPAKEVVFSSVPAFLIEQRTAELVEWAGVELSRGIIHPLFVLGTFHLLFLQLQPYPTANHRLAQLLTWSLLEDTGYSFVRYRHFTPALHRRAKQYFNALRQAEKTSYTTWSTLNIWLEFFLDTLIDTAQNLFSISRQGEQLARLSTIQRQIIEVVQTHGSLTRERIANETGINLSTVKYNLGVLAERGHLKREGGGRTTSYRVL